MAGEDSGLVASLTRASGRFSCLLARSVAASRSQPTAGRASGLSPAHRFSLLYGTMWRSFFLAVGVYVCLLGLEALAINKAILKPQMRGGQVVAPARDVTPPDWAPWSLLSGGSIVVLYSLTLMREKG